uniref:PET domain-containing protein n=1 Tax=Caenorhabditis tropicalis TaxID=1561998 RepID=A0A1I7UJ32_9PELO
MPQSGVAEVEVPGSVGHGYAWVPPGLSRKKTKMGLLTENMRCDPFMIRFMHKAGEFFRKTKNNWLIDVEEYMSQLPNNVVPRTNSSGEKLREKQLLVQLPRQDLSVAYCRHLTTQTERKVYEEFVNARNEIALDIGYVSSNINKAMECHKCSGILETNEMA